MALLSADRVWPKRAIMLKSIATKYAARLMNTKDANAARIPSR